MTAIVLRWRQVRPVALRWRGPTAGVLALAAERPSAVAAIIGAPSTVPGPPGPPGTPGDGATDPGDLTLIFNNKLI